MKFFGYAILWFMLLAATPPVAAADPFPPLNRAALDAAFRAQLEQLAAKCDDLGLPEQARQTRAWFRERDPAKIYLFVAPDDHEQPRAPENDLARKWQARFLALRQEQAASLFQRAQQALEAHDLSSALALAHETLHEDPDHAAARAALGYQKMDGRWRWPGPPAQARVGRAPHPKLGWAAGKYWRVETAHYEIVTSHGAEAGLQLGRDLEDLFAVWRQVFARYWTTEEELALRFQGQHRASFPARKFQVVLFRDSREYTEKLAAAQSQVGPSQGLYADVEHVAYFYAGDESCRATWHHEATHQLFQETGHVAESVAGSAHVWIVEGVALYMESLQALGQGCYALGGIESQRLQFARYRALNERAHLPLAEFAGLGRAGLQKRADMRQLYSQAAGLTHFLMHGGGGKYREKLVGYLAGVYANSNLPGEAVSKLLGVTPAELDAAYLQFLNVDDGQLAALARSAPKLSQLCLGNTQVTDKGLAQLAPHMQGLKWLDLAHTPTSEATLALLLSRAKKLVQLNLEGTPITDASCAQLAALSGLEELDLSATAITDAGVKSIASLKQLRVLYLTSTHISDGAVPALRGLVGLETLGIKGTALSPAAISQLEKSLPKWKRAP